MFSIIYEWQANADSFNDYDGGFETLDTVPTLREALKVLRDKAGSSSDFVEWKRKGPRHEAGAVLKSFVRAI